MPAMIECERGCGTRSEGGVYLESATSPFGLPLEDFLVDPPMPVDPDMDNITAIGIELFEGPDGITHILDWIGEKHYPYPTDFLEEGRRKGFSRRVSPVTEFWRLTPYQSRIFAVHAKGFIVNWRDYFDHEASNAGYRHCRLYRDSGNEAHVVFPTTSCSRYAWSAVPGVPGRGDMRSFTDFEYRIFPPNTPPHSDGIVPVYAPAIIASLPVTNLTVIAARDGSHEETAQRLRDEAKQMHVHIAPS